MPWVVYYSALLLLFGLFKGSSALFFTRSTRLSSWPSITPMYICDVYYWVLETYIERFSMMMSCITDQVDCFLCWWLRWIPAWAEDRRKLI